MVNWQLIGKICAYTAGFSMIFIGFLGFFAKAGLILVSIIESMYFVVMGFLFLSAQFEMKWYKTYFGFLSKDLGKASYCLLYFLHSSLSL